MNESLQTSASPVILLIGATVFVVLFTVILTTLRRAEAFPRGADVTLAICASLLTTIGIMRTFGQVGETAKNSGSSWLDLVLLPYTAMALAILLVLLLLLLRKVVSKGDSALRRLNTQIRSESRESTDAEHKHRQGDGNSRLATE